MLTVMAYFPFFVPLLIAIWLLLFSSSFIHCYFYCVFICFGILFFSTCCLFKSNSILYQYLLVSGFIVYFFPFRFGKIYAYNAVRSCASSISIHFVVCLKTLASYKHWEGGGGGGCCCCKRHTLVHFLTRTKECVM